jgi:hypothetical protein
LEGNYGIKEYKNGVRRLENFIPYTNGGCRYRPGFQYVVPFTTVLYANKPVINFPFVFSKEEPYLVALALADLDAADDAANDGRIRVFAEISGSWVRQTVTTSGGMETSPYSLSQPRSFPCNLTGVDPRGFQYSQSGDTLFLTHSSKTIPTIVVTRTATGVFSITTWEYYTGSNITWGTGATKFYMPKDGYLMCPFGPLIAETTITPSTVHSERYTLTASNAIFTDAASTEGQYIRLNYSDRTGIFIILDWTDTTHVEAAVVVNPAKTGPTVSYQTEMWGVEQGFPATCTMFNSRLLMGGSVESPDEIACSARDNFEILLQDRLVQDPASAGNYYFGTKVAGDAFSFHPASTESNSITWMKGQKGLLIGTMGEEYTANITGGEFSAIGTELPSIMSQTNHGGSYVMATKAGYKVFFVGRDGKSLKELGYSDENGSYTSTDLTIVNDEIMYHNRRGGTFKSCVFSQIVWQDSLNILWGLTSNGALVGLSYNRSTELLAWSKYTLGGDGAPAGSDGKIESICILPNEAGDKDNLFITVKRIVASAAIYNIEKMSDDYLGEYLGKDSETDIMNYLDSSKYGNDGIAAATVAFAGFNHLYGTGRQVNVLADGHILYEDVTVAVTGVITLPVAASYIVAGYSYTGYIETLNLEGGSQAGTSQILFMRLTKLLVKLLRSYSGYFGMDYNNMYEIEYKNTTAGELYTGNIEADVNKGGDKERSLIIKQDKPFPLSILSIIYRAETQE